MKKKSIIFASVISIMAGMTFAATAHAHERHDYSYQRYPHVIRVEPVTHAEATRTATHQLCMAQGMRREGRGFGGKQQMAYRQVWRTRPGNAGAEGAGRRSAASRISTMFVSALRGCPASRAPRRVPHDVNPH